jgi:signal recognition particle subunit SRP54
VQTRVDHEAVQKVATKLKRGHELNMEDFKQQLEQIAKMGGLESLLDKLPGLPAGAALPAQFDAKVIRRQIAMINSMTRHERRRPAIIDGSRKRRIAAGSGLTVQDVNRLLKQHKMLVKTMKRASKGGMAGMRQMLGNAMAARSPQRRR